MKYTLHDLALRFAVIAMVLGLGVLGWSCDETETTDSTTFALYYPGVTDIGPSMNFNLPAPSYIGAAPSGFSISGITLDGEPVTTESITIDANTGSVTIANTDNMAVGLYKISVSCVSAGKSYYFPDAISINMMKAVPDGISVEPSRISADYGDIIDATSSVELPTATVTTDGNHITISKYAISNVRKDGVKVEKNDFFRISNSGVISIVRGESSIAPGIYELDLRLTTAAISDEDGEEGLFAKALVIDVTSRPLSLTYAPSEVRVEENIANTSVAPEFVGSVEGLKYSIKSVEPATSAVSIDPATGAVSIAKDNGLAIGTELNVSVTVENQFGKADFDNVFKMIVVGFINPITKVVYDEPGELIQGGAFTNPLAEIAGDEATFSFKDLPAALSELRIDPNTGEITAPKGNNIPVGTYTVTVVATNNKGQMEASFTLKVVENNYRFTYVNWGNNLALAPVTDYASQYRVSSKGELANLKISIAESDIREGVKPQFAIAGHNFGKTDDVNNISIDADGNITFNEAGFAAGAVRYAIIRVTTGKGTAGETINKIPVFVHCNGAVKGVTVEYTPFVLQCNPRKGITSAAPVINGADMSKFLMDYRRAFNYWNINGPAEHIDGQPSKAGSLMNSLWTAYYKELNKQPNTGQRWPCSWIDDNTNMSRKLAYVDKDKNWAHVVNPNKWQNDYGFANGIFIGQITFAVDGTTASVAGGSQIFPVAVWFDTKFE